MYSKIEIGGDIEVVTGMHIGGVSGFSAIGAIDSPVVFDVISGKPMIPGSSLKGKLRSLISKQYSDGPINSHDNDPEIVLRLFGCAKKQEFKNSRLQFSDLILSGNKNVNSELPERMTEVKFENTIDRLIALATPRQIERVIRGSIFPMSLIYNVNDESQIEEDFKALAEGFKLLKFDYLGGHGSRGYGRVKINDIFASCVTGDIDDELIDKCNDILK